MENTTLANVLQGDSLEAEGYGNLFAGLMRIIDGTEINDSLGKRIGRYILDCLAANPPRGFDTYSETSYIRTYLGRDAATGWEAIMMSWRAGNTTPIHAHPQFAGYHFADGIFRVEIFEPAGNGTARRIKDMTVTAPYALHATGTAGRFDNHIHRITCLSPTGHSLHVYSDDARRGLVYAEVQE